MKWLMLVCLFFLLVQCTKNIPPPGLPAITEEGKNTLGFKLNGNTWVPFFHCGFFSGPQAAFNIYMNRDSVLNYSWPMGFDLHAQRASGNSRDYFEMKTRSFDYQNPSNISHTGNIFDSLEISFQNTGDCCYIYSSIPFNSPGSVNITKLDTLNKIVSGTFSFILYTYRGQDLDSVVITDGRFDLKFDASVCY